MKHTKDDLKKYIVLLERLEVLYNMYNDVDKYPKYRSRILKKYIKKEYKKILKSKKLRKVKDLQYFLNKSDLIYNLDFKEHFKTINNEFDLLKFYDKILLFFKKKYKSVFELVTETTLNKNVFCVDCKRELKGTMIKYHVQGKKHNKNKKSGRFLNLIGNKEQLKKSALFIVDKINKEKGCGDV